MNEAEREGVIRQGAFGPFYRTGDAQDDATTQLQRESGEIQGGPDRGSFFPSVDAHVGNLPDGKPGVEFYTDVRPDRGTPPANARWHGAREGILQRGDKIGIEATITNFRFRQ